MFYNRQSKLHKNLSHDAHSKKNHIVCNVIRFSWKGGTLLLNGTVSYSWICFLTWHNVLNPTLVLLNTLDLSPLTWSAPQSSQCSLHRETFHLLEKIISTDISSIFVLNESCKPFVCRLRHVLQPREQPEQKHEVFVWKNLSASNKKEKMYASDLIMLTSIKTFVLELRDVFWYKGQGGNIFWREMIIIWLEIFNRILSMDLMQRNYSLTL